MFYAVSEIFQPYNGGASSEGVPYLVAKTRHNMGTYNIFQTVPDLRRKVTPKKEHFLKRIIHIILNLINVLNFIELSVFYHSLNLGFPQY